MDRKIQKLLVSSLKTSVALSAEVKRVVKHKATLSVKKFFLETSEGKQILEEIITALKLHSVDELKSHKNFLEMDDCLMVSCSIDYTSKLRILDNSLFGNELFWFLKKELGCNLQWLEEDTATTPSKILFIFDVIDRTS